MLRIKVGVEFIQHLVLIDKKYYEIQQKGQ